MPKKLTIQEISKIATSRGGKCLSIEYANSCTTFKWRCKEGHVWAAPLSRVKNGHWCRKCSAKVRAAAKVIFGVQHPQTSRIIDHGALSVIKSVG